MTGLRPWRIAVVGSGPSGMYATGHLTGFFSGGLTGATLSDLPGDGHVEVDIYDRLATPWGLLRGGIAPDHASKKGVTRVFNAISTNPAVRFFGNVNIGHDVTTNELADWYDAVIYAYGAASGRRLDIPGADLPGVHTAHDVVAWYNGHPDYADLDPNLDTDRAVIIGNGNVALDVARLLVLPPDGYAVTDIAPHAETALEASAIRNVAVIGRRGPTHAAFGTAEIEELTDAGGVHAHVDPADLPDTDDDLDGPTRRKIATLHQLAQPATADTEHRHVHLRFHEQPEQIVGDTHATHIQLASTRPDNPTDRPTRLETGLIIFAAGYQAHGLPGLPFDQNRGVLPNQAGRITPANGRPQPGAYTTGWIKRGPSGMIGTNKACARETVTTLTQDALAGRLPTETTITGQQALERLLKRQPDIVTWAGWKAIDLLETRRGRPHRRPRIKIVNTAELLTTANTRNPPKT